MPPRPIRVEPVVQPGDGDAENVNMTISLAFIAPGLVKAAIVRSMGSRLGLAHDSPGRSGILLSGDSWERSARRHTFSAPGTGIFASETEARIAPSARSGDWEDTVLPWPWGMLPKPLFGIRSGQVTEGGSEGAKRAAPAAAPTTAAAPGDTAGGETALLKHAH